MQKFYTFGLGVDHHDRLSVAEGNDQILGRSNRRVLVGDGILKTPLTVFQFVNVVTDSYSPKRTTYSGQSAKI